LAAGQSLVRINNQIAAKREAIAVNAFMRKAAAKMRYPCARTLTHIGLLLRT
jgi:hypothetical protein